MNSHFMNMHGTLRAGSPALAVLILSTLVLAMAPSSAPIGDWDGKIDTGNGILRVVAHISQEADGRLTGTLDSPDQNASGIVLGTVTYKKPDLHFAIESLGSSYDGRMNLDNSEITGEWKQSGLSLPLAFKRRTQYAQAGLVLRAGWNLIFPVKPGGPVNPSQLSSPTMPEVLAFADSACASAVAQMGNRVK